MLEWLRYVTLAHGVGPIGAYAAVMALLGMGAMFGLTRGGNAMATATVTPAVEVIIPAIDAKSPRQTKTATFSLG